MSYKLLKKDSQLLTKLRLVRRIKVDGRSKVETAFSFGCHRNTVSNLVHAFETDISPLVQQNLLINSFSLDQLEKLLFPLKDISTKPHHHPRQATQSQTDRVKEIFLELKVKVGPQRLSRILKRKFKDKDTASPLDASLAAMKLPQLKGIYKRERLKVEKARTASGVSRPLYDYTALSCFERMHFDTKHLLDKKSLPPKVYDYFSSHLDTLPKYEWNLIDAKSRFRFMAFSYELNSEYGLKFLLFCLQFIRTITNNINQGVVIGEDNGMEFCSGSLPKLSNWNSLLKILNAQAYAYNPYWDVRKNLIERSHRIDDDEWLIPRGEYITDEKSFLKEADDYWYYTNFERSHGGKGMNDRTPFEVLENSGLLGVNQFMKFPILILDHHIDSLRKCTEPLLFEYDVKLAEEKRQGVLLDPKTLLDISSKYDFFIPNAQKVLTYYLPVL
ncbi:MAG: hypothetical protein NTV24_03850 [Candidatus Woesebacteria bacterium]|nr:hypothetical protein [Candidatus Woesebacteria bacterium]